MQVRRFLNGVKPRLEKPYPSEGWDLPDNKWDSRLRENDNFI